MDFNTQNYTFLPGTHRHKNVIWIVFPYDRNLIDALKKHAKAQWSSSNGSAMRSAGFQGTLLSEYR